MMPRLTDNLPCPRLSVALIVRNEQDVVAATLESVALLADEMVVLDTGSRDDTVAVAKRLGAQVHHAAWADDFAAARNACLRHATGHWVLWLDAGERFDPAAIRSFRAFIDHRADGQKAYSLSLEAPPWRIVQPRLMPNRADLRFVGRVRESLHGSLQNAEIYVENAPGRIFSHPRRSDPAVRISRANRNLALVRAELSETRQRKPRLLLVMAEALADLGHVDQARDFFLEAALSADRGSLEQLEAYHQLLMALGDEPATQARKLGACLQAIEIFPWDAALLVTMGHCLLAQGRRDLAARSFEAALKHGQVTTDVWHVVNLKDQAAAALAGLLRNSAGGDSRHLRIDCGESAPLGPSVAALGWKPSVPL